MLRFASWLIGGRIQWVEIKVGGKPNADIIAEQANQ